MLPGNKVLLGSSSRCPGEAGHNCSSGSILSVPGTIPAHQQQDKGTHDHILQISTDAL